jgi:hypothetical protein
LPTSEPEISQVHLSGISLHLNSFQARSSPSLGTLSQSCDIFIPSLNPSPALVPLSRELWLLLEDICQESGVFFSIMNQWGKNEDTVDVGGEMDYAGYQWFQDPPPRPEVLVYTVDKFSLLMVSICQPSAPQTPARYLPSRSVIELNQAFDFALKAAPNVLYARFKQYGQVCRPFLSLYLNARF